MPYIRKKSDSEGKPLCDLIIRGCPKSLRQAFRARCVLHAISVKDKMLHLMRMWLREQGDK